MPTPTKSTPARRRARRGGSGPESTLVLFVRHGQTPTTGKELPGRARGLHLSDTGRTQAEAVAQRLATVARIDAIYASPLERARETAAPLAGARGMKPIIDKGLLEVDTGEWTGKLLADARREPAWKVVQGYPSGFRFPGGESLAEMRDRMVSTVDRLRRAHPGGTIVAFSHADPIKAVVADALGSHLDHYQRLVISPCSVSAVFYSDHGPTVLSVNSVGDLSTLGPH
jgi:probable phosphomutase (TIGR03848 family)